jgi:hypothetical protein
MTYAKLKPEFKAKWLEALRSGKYAQTYGALQDSAGFCCLGVACDMVAPDKWIDVDNADLKRHGESGFMPDPAICEAMFIDDAGVVVTNTKHRLVCMNDDECKSFAEVADWIEENL